MATSMRGGLKGMPRRTYDPPGEYQLLSQVSMVGAMMLGFSQLISFTNMTRSWRHGEEAPDDVWE